ncbi:response regulator transcription factor [Zwartia vadi]|uniref:response regulator transcription factor n=1 Tax=Zwartia vadi TaxID=3058168 RepID=UPI0025B3F01E|nr:response regulator transcription factor [Zwartia vadi]MDN3986557.1 response regulator transcription factor [Zwartia vadi]
MPPKVLIVEDEVEFRDGLVELLTLENFDANGVGSIQEYLDWIQSNQYDILILDRNLPDGDGLDILRKYPKQSGTDSIVLSCEGQPHDRILGMNVDADYYLVKPFPSDELLAILHRIERRQSAALSTDSETWRLNAVRWELKTPNNLEIELTRSEFALLNCFVQKSGQVIARDDIIKGLGFNPLVYDNRRLEVMLRRLRKKIEDAGVVKFPLQTVYGVGLAFNGIMKASD